MTRYAYDPVNHWMGSKIVNWIRFFGVDPENWKVDQKGGTAWIAKRPFTTLAQLEKHMPKLPKLDEVREWFTPFLATISEICARHDLVWVGGVEGPVTDAYSYMDMELFASAIYDAPELVAPHHGLHGKVLRVHCPGLCRAPHLSPAVHGGRHLRLRRADLQPAVARGPGGAALALDHGPRP